MVENRVPDGDVSQRATELRSVVVSYDDRPDECTIYPPGVTGMDRMSTWISADEGSFVELDAIR